uniref:Uncharacterized protein n=1 Tax=Sparus aurata TaxID=8175 RepID=A0A671TQH5_SPAAU
WIKGKRWRNHSQRLLLLHLHTCQTGLSCHYVFWCFSQCLWCIKTKSCVTYPVRTILPPHSLCPLNDARWGLCWMNFQALIITLAVVGGIIIIAALVCLFCCCKCENFGGQDAEAGQQDENQAGRKVRSDVH